jgi:hypothetical protein
MTALFLIRVYGLLLPPPGYNPPRSLLPYTKLHKEELSDQWKESITVPAHKKGDKTDCSNYRWISLLSTSYKIVSNILLPRLSPYIDEIIADHKCGFRRNRQTTDQIFCIRQILEKKLEYNETVH